MNVEKYSLAGFLLVFSFVPVLADTVLPVCPLKISTEQTLKPASNDWTSTQSDITHNLLGMDFYQGPISERAQLMPSGELRKGGSVLTTWIFSGPISPINVACHYAGTSIILSQPLPEKVSSCTIASDRKTRRVDAASVRCKP
jgi:hypothetical protein